MFSCLFLFFIQLNNPGFHLQMLILLSLVINDSFHHPSIYCWCHWGHTCIHLMICEHLSWWIVLHIWLGHANASSSTTSSEVTTLGSSLVCVGFEYTLFVSELRFYVAWAKGATEFTGWFCLISLHGAFRVIYHFFHFL